MTEGRNAPEKGCEGASPSGLAGHRWSTIAGLLLSTALALLVTSLARSEERHKINNQAILHQRASLAAGQTASRQMMVRPELVLQGGHSKSVEAVAFSPGGRWLASGSQDRTLRLWDLATGSELRSFIGHQESINAVAVSPNGRMLATGSSDHTIKLWDVKSGRELLSLQPSTESIIGSQIHSVAFSPDGRWLASAGWDDRSVRLWDLKSGKEIHTFLGHSSYVNAVVFSPDGRRLASASHDRTIRLWDLKTGQTLRTFTGHTGWVSSVKFSPNGRWLASGSYDNTVKIWNVSMDDAVLTLGGQKYQVTSVAFSPDGKSLASAGIDHAIRIREVPSGKLIRTLVLDDSLLSVAFSPDGRFLAGGRWDGSIDLWAASGKKPPRRLRSQLDLVTATLFSPDGHWLACVSGPEITLWETATGRALRSLRGHKELVTSLAFSPDSQWIASGSYDKTAKIWDMQSSKIYRNFTGMNNWITSVAFSPDGQLLAAGSSNAQTIKAWETSTGQQHQLPPGLGGFKGAFSFSPDWHWLAAGMADNSIAVIETSSGEEMHTFGGGFREGVIPDGLIQSIAFSHDGNRVASSSWDGSIRLWDIATEKKLLTLRPDSMPGPVAFSHDDRWLASAQDNNRLILWDSSSGQIVSVLKGHTDRVETVAFFPHGGCLVSGSGDGTARIWDVPTGELLATLVKPARTSDWAVVTPDGLFDGSPGAWQQILWRFNNDTFDVAPVELFFNEYYAPGLLADILAGQRPKAATDIVKKDRRQPSVKLELAEGEARSTPTSTRTLRVAVKVQEMRGVRGNREHPKGSGVRDVRLFRNGSLVKVWHGNLPLNKEGKATLETRVTIVAGENHLTAYAFNRDNIKSQDATLNINGAALLKRRGTAYILAIGINKYSDPDYNLLYAASDARDFAEEVRNQLRTVGEFSHTEIIHLLDQNATRSNILLALKQLAGRHPGPLPGDAPRVLARLQPARPEDAVFIYYAGHGTTSGPSYYLIPQNLGYTGSREGLEDSGLQKILDHSISNLDLEQILENMDAGWLVLVIDACRSGQALQTEDPRQGPMNSKGLAQLAYDKGIYILTASQGYQAALEATKYRHGLLTYALVEKGLKSGRADDSPRDGQITLREWLDYAGQEVPQLQLALMREARSGGRDLAIVEGEQKIPDLMKRSLQRPRLFYRREPEAKPFIIGKP